nr:MAG TPA: hypothetical protein [Herelleviridae sp.]
MPNLNNFQTLTNKLTLCVVVYLALRGFQQFSIF